MVAKLSDLTMQLGITTRAGLNAYIEKNYPLGSEASLPVLRKKELGLDSESRIHDETYELKNAIIDVPEISLRDSRSVTFTNCIFTGNVHVTQHQDATPIKVHFFRCICIGKINLVGFDNASDVVLDTTNATRVTISVSTICSLDLTLCHLAMLVVEECSVEKFDTYANRFDGFEIVNCKLEDVKFDHSQIVIEESRSPFDVFKQMKFPPTEEESYSGVRRSETMRFLLERTKVHLDRHANAQIKYQLSIASRKSGFARTLLKLTGAFLFPSRIFLLMVVCLLAYGCLFATPALRFGVSEPDAGQKTTVTVIRSLSICEALYYSGVTFTTIGYGDVSPQGVARLMAVSEGFIGVTLASAFLVALTRKYVD